MPVPARSTSATPGPLRAYLTRLEQLADVLARSGLRSRVVAPPGRAPCLHVVNPATVALAEDIYTGRDGDGCWWYWWPWAEPIAPGTDPEAAAARIAHVLAVSG